MSGKISAKDYPEHLNPFDENYNGVVVEPTNSRQKYNTWSSSHQNKVSALAKPKPTFLEKPWTALNISPKGKIVRRLSILKTAVEKFASKKKLLTHSSSQSEVTQPPRSHSLHDEFNFKIISPKQKDKLRQQAFSRSLSKEDDVEIDPIESSRTTQVDDGRLSLPLKDEHENSPKLEDSSTITMDTGKERPALGARPKTRKKRPPPPPPTEIQKTVNLELTNGEEKMEDSYSANSSITQDLEKDATSEEESSSTELENQNIKLSPRNI